MTPEAYAYQLLRPFNRQASVPSFQELGAESKKILAPIVTALSRACDFSGPQDRFGRRSEDHENPDALQSEPLLLRSARQLWGNDFQCLEPRLHLSHDIDRLGSIPKPLWPRTRKQILRLCCGLRFQGAAKLFKALKEAQKQPGIDVMTQLLELGQGIPRTIFVTQDFDNDFDAEPLKDTPAHSILKNALENSPELHLGYHPGFEINSQQALRKGKQALEASYIRKVQRLRFHYLRLAREQALSDIEHIGCRWDSSIGFSKSWGARYGLHIPFHPVLKSGQVLHLFEAPLLFMDTSLSGKKDPIKELYRFLDWVLHFGARGSVLIHNHSSASVDLLQAFLKGCKERSIKLVDFPELSPKV